MSFAQPEGICSSFNEALKATKSCVYRTLARVTGGADTEEDMPSSGGSEWWVAGGPGGTKKQFEKGCVREERKVCTV